jgi:AraC-like DNA-binding protein
MDQHAPPLRQHLAAGAGTARHRHEHGYAALVLDGGYVEAGDAGRRAVSAGEVVLHEGFEAHFNRFGGRGANVLNLPLPDGWRPTQSFMSVSDPDRIARIAERDVHAATAGLLEQLAPVAQQPGDWPDHLAAALRNDSRISLAAWASNRGIAPGSVSRGFRQAYGVSPARYRSEARARQALRRLSGPASLADLALETGFADQAHMTRAIVALTGRTPGGWRRLSPFKIEAPAAG